MQDMKMQDLKIIAGAENARAEIAGTENDGPNCGISC